MRKKFETNTARVKSISFHPVRPWVIAALHSGVVQIWDYNMKITIAKYENFEGAMRAVHFHHTLPLFVTGGDEGTVKVFNYKQKRCLFSLKGHIDYIRVTYFHHEMPWILSASDDQTMRIWNYQSRTCINIITGHAHFIMCAQFHPEKNLIVSGSLDCTVRIWDFTVLKKKLTESKNQSGFVGIEIQCIKILEGHQRGVNWVCFHPYDNVIASAADDRKIKLWKFTNEVAWEHFTIPGHVRNVSCVIFDPMSGLLISNSEDMTTRIWNPQNQAHIVGHKKNKERYWTLAITKNGSLVASGHDAGMDFFQLNKEKMPCILIDQDMVLYTREMKVFIYHISRKVLKEQIQPFTTKIQESPHLIDRIICNPFAPDCFMMQVREMGQKVYLIKKKANLFTHPVTIHLYPALDSCFVSKTHVATLQNNHQIHVSNYLNLEEKVRAIVKLLQDTIVLRIFNCEEQNLIFLLTQKQLIKYNLPKNQIVARCFIESEAQIGEVSIFEKMIAIVGKFKIIVTNISLEHVTTINEKLRIQSIYWESNRILFYTTTSHWKYSLLNGETGLIGNIEQPLYLLKKLPSKNYLAFNIGKRMFELQYKDLSQIEFKLAIIDKDWVKAKQVLEQVGKNNRSLMAHLVKKGYSHIALDLVDNPEEKFSLAIQSTNFNMAFEICKEMNTPQYWKMLGDQALKQGIYQAYQVSCQKLKSYDKLNFLYSLQGNVEKLQKMMKLTKKTGNTMLSFNTALFLNRRDEREQILRDIGLERLAELSTETSNPEGQQSEILKKLGCKPLNPVKIEHQADFSNWPHTVAADDQEGSS